MSENENEDAVSRLKLIADSLNVMLGEIRHPLKDEGVVTQIQALLPSQTLGACELLFKVAIEDLERKLKNVGPEWVSEIASAGKQPIRSLGTDFKGGSADDIIDLSLKTGLLLSMDWKRLKHCSRILEDLKECNSERLLLENSRYVFSVLTDAVLSKAPLELLKVKEPEQLTGMEGIFSLSPKFYEAYEKAASDIQFDWIKQSIAVILDNNSSYEVRENRLDILRSLQAFTRTETKTGIAQYLEKNNRIDMLTAQIGNVTQATPYFSTSSVDNLYQQFSQELKSSIGNAEREIEMVRKFDAMGGLKYCPGEYYGDILKRLFLIYTNDAHTLSYGGQDVVRIISEILEGEGQKITPYLKAMRENNATSTQEFSTSLFYSESSIWTKLRKWIDTIAFKGNK
ncbi:MAG TPA: hypothetical protein VL098_05025 [Flavipsychrobacter sp.]|nr:hypothetical protein [Flavipsychrobacter sp.]